MMSPIVALAADLADRRPPAGPLIVGLTGAVAAGKSTLAGELKSALSGKAAVEIIATDGFLRPNAELTALGLLEQKGFPPTYDNDAFRAALNDIRSGPAVFPTYSHTAYDIDPALALDPVPAGHTDCRGAEPAAQGRGAWRPRSPGPADLSGRR